MPCSSARELARPRTRRHPPARRLASDLKRISPLYGWSAPAVDREAWPHWREIAERMFSRAAGAPLIGGNRVELLRDGRQNYPRWLAAIAAAKRHVHFENYFIQDDEIGHAFADAFIAKAREGVHVRVLCDWLGGIGKTSRGFWRMLEAGNVEVRRYNPPRFSSPLAWVSRDHRKMLVVDGDVGFISGLCVGDMWLGDPARGLEPWRDTGIEVRGAAVAEMERAFGRMWAATGSPLRRLEIQHLAEPAGDVSMRIVSTEPGTGGMLRLDELVAAMARERLWLTDAYYSGLTPYVEALRAAARDGVDVRLLVPSVSDLRLVKAISRAGYRALLEAGARIFEWDGAMLHAKTAVVDGRWARVGSTNLNASSWLGNCELDAVIEDTGFAAEMEQTYLRDLTNATEIVLDEQYELLAPGEPRHVHVPGMRTGSAGAAAASAVRIGSTVGAVLANRRALGPMEVRLTTVVGLLLLALSALFAVFPGALTYPIVAFGLWGALALLWRGVRLSRRGTASRPGELERGA